MIKIFTLVLLHQLHQQIGQLKSSESISIRVCDDNTFKEGLDHVFYIKSKDVPDHVQMKYQK